MSVWFKSVLWAGILLAAVVAGMHFILTQGRGDNVVVEVGGHSITRQKFEEGLRDHLWRSSASWQAMDAESRRLARAQVLDTLIDDHLVRAARLLEGSTPVVPAVNERRELDMMRRQFADTDGYAGRLAGQQHTQKSLNGAIHDAQLDEAWLAQKMAPRLSEITQREVRAWYDRFKETLRIPVAQRAAHIFLARSGKADRKNEIDAIHRQLMAQEKPFAELAVSRSEDARTKALGGELGWFTRQRMPDDFMTAVEKLQVGKVSFPVTTRLGWHVIWLKERRAARAPSFDEVRAEIYALLTTQEREAEMQKLLTVLRLHSRIVRHQRAIDQSVPR